MSSSRFTGDSIDPVDADDAQRAAAQIWELLPDFRAASSPEQALELLRRALQMIGAESGVFLSAIKDDASRTSIRSLLACDPRWTVEYSHAEWSDHDPWLRHAMESQTPVRSTELRLRPADEAFISKASSLGFASSLVVPAPTSFGAARFGVLIVGSSDPAHYDSSRNLLVEIVARSLAMELHEWLLRTVREDLLEISRLTPQEINLLRHEAAGHTSKMIAAEANVKPPTVDGWFQRINAKLNAPDRRTAMRIARLYGLI
jgi:DNA-binding CsgD family transcriptional regulator